MAQIYKVFLGKDGQWYFNILGANGFVMATSEGYTRRRDAMRGITALRERLAETEPTEAQKGRPLPGSQRQWNRANYAALAFDPGLA